jgi:hypothetical protein
MRIDREARVESVMMLIRPLMRVPMPRDRDGGRAVELHASHGKIGMNLISSEEKYTESNHLTLSCSVMPGRCNELTLPLH